MNTLFLFPLHHCLAAYIVIFKFMTYSEYGMHRKCYQESHVRKNGVLHGRLCAGI